MPAIAAPCRSALSLTAALLCAGMVTGARAAGPTMPSSSTAIYTCIDDKGRRLTSDRPIAECLAREQQVRNRDGSVKQVVPPTLTADERATQEANERRVALERAAQADAVRRDRNLIARFPNEAAHRKAREAALDTVRQAQKATEQRLKELAVERMPIDAEAEFYKGRVLPARVKLQIDANDAAVDAQHQAAVNQEAELKRINQLYDAELDRLKRLWAGAQPGSIGPATQPTEVKAPASSSARR